jgi:hypothetical protein
MSTGAAVDEELARMRAELNPGAQPAQPSLESAPPQTEPATQPTQTEGNA